MNKYANAAVRAVKLYGKLDASPQEAWSKAISDFFERGSDGYKKGCPRNAFLGLCEEGLVSGFPRGHYTQSRKNKDYAIRALSLLKQRKALANDLEGLWRTVMKGEKKKHNSQMDVVVALWNSGLLK